MTRPPKARQKVLDAARRIVESRGAGHLTFETLAEESGVTRGGITYHFRTKEELLKALIEADIAQWDSNASTLSTTADIACPKAARLLGHVRCSLADDDDAHRRFVTGLLSAAMVDPNLLDPVRAHTAREFADWQWDDADLERYLLLLAADGLFWCSVFNMSPLPGHVRPRLVALIEAKVRALAATDVPLVPPAPTSPSPFPPSET